MHSLGVYKVQEQGGYVLIPDLHIRGVAQEKYGPERKTIQLDDKLVLKKKPLNFMASLKQVATSYALKVLGDAIAR